MVHKLDVYIMKKVFSVLVLCGFTSVLVAQTKDTHHHELGVNATLLIAKLFGVEDDNEDHPYSLIYKYHFNEKFALRSGLGGRYLSGSKNSQTGELTSIRERAFQFRIGAERKYLFLNKWVINLGLDGFYKYVIDKEIYDSKIDVITNTEERGIIGIGPILGLQFYITPRVIIGSEFGLFHTTDKRVSKVEFEQYPEFNEAEESNFTKIKTAPPTALFFTVRF